MKKQFYSSLAFTVLALVILLAQLVIPVGCANQVPPLGGPKDSIPPTLIGVRPQDSATNFNSKKIIFDFNEYVTVDNPTENLLISPTPKISPEVTYKLRTITVTIKDTLEPNTTYSYNFGKSIKDINEGNVLKDFTYVFSTGSSLDTLQLEGKVIMAETGKTDSTLIAVLYKSPDDSAVVRERARYIARMDKNGNYLFKNLPAGRFYLYAFVDEGGQKRWAGKKTPFAFADKPIDIGKTFVADTMYAYVEKDETPPKSSSAPRSPGGRNAPNANADKKLRLETSVQNGEQDLLNPFEVYFRSAPVKSFDSTKIQFVDEKLSPIANYSFVRDTSNKKITLQYKFAPGTIYSIIVDKDFAEDTAGRKLAKNDTLKFKTKGESSYGSIRWRFPTLDLSRNPVLLLVQSEEVKFKHVFTNKEFVAKLFMPGDFELRILYDSNKNGMWDPGQFFNGRKQPEIVIQVPRKITVKPNWDNESDFTL